jgi:glycogen operon protein
LLAGDALDWRDAKGDPVIDDSFLLLLNGSRRPVDFVLPSVEWGKLWALRIDTRERSMLYERVLDAGARITLDQNTTMVLKRVLPGRGAWRPSTAAMMAVKAPKSAR